jgi:alkylation response protein AidB-like acyl-CoA dehydrogenase
MDFRPSEQQEDLRDGIRAFAEARCTDSELHRFAARGGFDRDLWRDLADLGIFQLRLPESAREGQEGLGLGAADAVLVFEELGRRIVPGPLAWSQIAADLIPGAATGERVVGGLDHTTTREGPHLVEHRDDLDDLLVLRPEGVFRIDPQSLPGENVNVPLDPMTPLFHVSSEALPQGERLGDASRSALLRLEGMALVAAQLLGIAEATLEIALAYAKEREQFGRTIGSFQAIKHLLSDMFARQELARASTYAAGATLDDPEVGSVEQSVCGALLVAGEAAAKNARTCIQIHGGMGYTWEVADHYFMKRAAVLEHTFGDADEHCAAIAGIVSRDTPLPGPLEGADGQ